VAGQWLRERAAPRDILVAYEIGTIAYLSSLKIFRLAISQDDARPSGLGDLKRKAVRSVT
jgi:hypothetical protein